MQVWPGSAYPLGRDLRRLGHQLRAVQRGRREGRAVPVRRRRHRDAGRPARDRTASSGTASCPASSPASATATACTARTTRTHGQRCNPNKLLLDPYAKAIDGTHRVGRVAVRLPLRRPGQRNDDDSAAHMPKCVVINPFFDWGVDRPPQAPVRRAVIYEAHVKGLTQTHPDVPEELRGTYAGIAHPAIIEHLTAARRHRGRADARAPLRQRLVPGRQGPVELLGLQHDRLLRPGPQVLLEPRRPAGRCRSSRRWCATLHEAGIEVILDVVYNHTAEGNHLGPDAVVPRHRQRGLLPARRRRPAATTWTTPAPATPSTSGTRTSLQLIMDSLRYWVTEMHVDGFRFDLAATLAREFYDVDRLSSFFELVQQDPVVSQVKLIAEPWDVGPGGYQVGNFPPQWTEWNGKYRDTVRDFWRGEPATIGEFAARHHRLGRPVRDLRPPPGAPASTSSPRTTASRCATSSPTTRSTTRPTATTTTTARATTARGTAASRATTDDAGDPRAAGPAAAQLPRHAVPVARACR